MKRRTKPRAAGNAAPIRPEFAALGEMVRPILLFGLLLVAVKTTAFYYLFDGARFMSPLTFGAFLFVLAAYAGWLGLVISPVIHRAETANQAPAATAARGIVAAGE
jgi:hypothetical protein